MKHDSKRSVRWLNLCGAAAMLLAGACSDDAPGGDGAVDPAVEVLTAFDPANLELPEGLSISGGDAYVGMAMSATIERISLADGSRSVIAKLPAPTPDTGFLTGVDIGPKGRLHAALVSFTGDPAPGVYRVEDGEAVLFAAHPSLVFPNGLAWGAGGELYVTDSAAGAVFVADSSGATTEWLADSLLAGDDEACGGSTTGIAVGANGIVRAGDALLIASSDQGVVLRVPIEADGSAGAVAVLAGPDCELAGIDGVVRDGDGSLIAAINRHNRLVRIAEDGRVTVLYEGEPLDFPASPALNGSDLYVTSFAIGNALAGVPAAPALLRLRLP